MSSAAGASGTPLTRTLTIKNSRGLHARASAKFVQCVEAFDVEIWVEREGQKVPGTSIMGLMMLGATPGTEIQVSSEGAEAEAALRAVEALIDDNFGEED